MSMRKFSLFPATISALLVGAMFSSSAYAQLHSLPGINDSGSPTFNNSVKVTLNPNNGTIKATGRKDFILDTSSGLYNGTSGVYSLQVDFNKQTHAFEGGTVSLTGAIADLGITDKKTLLMSADINAFNITTDPTLWGFNTINLFCSPQLFFTCTPSESVYIELDAAFDGMFQGNFKTTGFAITTLPVPAAAWLFGSALGLLGWVRRRSTSTPAAA